jgi:hypothetical protein
VLVSGYDAGDQVIAQAINGVEVPWGEHRLRPTQYASKEPPNDDARPEP